MNACSVIMFAVNRRRSVTVWASATARLATVHRAVPAVDAEAVTTVVRLHLAASMS